MNEEIKKMKIDGKGRITVPKNSIIGKSEKVLIEKEDDLTFSLYDLFIFNGYIEKLKRKREKAFDSGDMRLFEYLNNKINLLMISKFGVSDTDGNNRILLSSMIREMYDLKNEILLFSGEDHLKAFNDMKNYQEYEKRLINNMRL